MVTYGRVLGSRYIDICIILDLDWHGYIISAGAHALTFETIMFPFWRHYEEWTRSICGHVH